MITRRHALTLGTAGLLAPVVLAGCSSGDDTPATPTVVPTPTEIPPATGSLLGENTISGPVTYADDGTVSTYQGDPARSGAMPGPGPSWTLPIIVKWKYDLGSNESVNFKPSAPVVVNGIVYMNFGRDVVALDAHSSAEVWRFTTGDQIGSVPTVAGGILFVGSNDDHLYAINAETGQGIWKANLGNAIHGSPAVVENLVFTSAIGSRGRSERGEGMIFALDALTGNETWRFVMDGLSYCAPAVVNGAVFATSTSGLVYALDAATGSERWRYSMKSGGRCSPCVSDGVVFVGGGDYQSTVDTNFYALDAVTGNEIWRFDMGSMLGSNPTVSGGLVYAGDDAGVTYAVDATTGRERWRTTWNAGFYTNYSVSVADGVAYQGLRALDITSGSAIPGYEYGAITEVSSGPRSSQAIVDGVVYVATLEYLFAIGNLTPMLTNQAVSLRGAPSPSGAERLSLAAGDEVDRIVSREETSQGAWLQVVVGSETGWIPLDAIDPATMPPEGELEYLYAP